VYLLLEELILRIRLLLYKTVLSLIMKQKIMEEEFLLLIMQLIFKTVHLKTIKRKMEQEFIQNVLTVKVLFKVIDLQEI